MTAKHPRAPLLTARSLRPARRSSCGTAPLEVLLRPRSRVSEYLPKGTAIYRGRGDSPPPGKVSRIPSAATGGLSALPAWMGFGYVTVLSMFLGFFAWYHGLTLGGVARVSQVQLAQPLLTLAWSLCCSVSTSARGRSWPRWPF